MQNMRWCSESARPNLPLKPKFDLIPNGSDLYISAVLLATDVSYN